VLALEYTQIMYNQIAVQGSLWFPRRAAGEMIANDRRGNA
jgi:hypothetical protein